jgi:hypothetical protein
MLYVFHAVIGPDAAIASGFLSASLKVVARILTLADPCWLAVAPVVRADI